MSWPQRRASDASLRARFLVWWSLYWELIVGVWLITLTGGLLLIGVRSYETNQQLLYRERICSDTNQGGPCRDLFDRIERSVTADQLHRRACATLATFTDPDLVRIRSRECP